MIFKHTISVICLIFCAHFGQISVYARTSNDLRITLPNGNKLVGRAWRSHDGRPIRAFLGIPYAKPPLGKLRFKAPVPIGKWEGELQATEDKSVCTQIFTFARDPNVTGSEDCLYINVYTPHKFNEQLTKLPVMVFFHPGGFLCGAGTSDFFGPDHLLDHDVILIGVGYRLGPLGFLSTGQEDCPGNFGLKDQVEVLRWIKENIVAFGGDSNSVTVFGNSAGGASVTYLMMSPLTKGLITRAIAQSGTNLDSWALPAHEGVAAQRAIKLAKSMNCSHWNEWSDTIDCLRTVSAEKITLAMHDYFLWDWDPMVPFPPVIEPDLPGAFITEDPRNKHSQKALSIPFMTGITYDDGTLKSAALLNLPGLFDDFLKNLKSALSVSLYYDHHEKSVQESMTKRIIDYYFNGETPDLIKHAKNITDLYTDGWFFAGMDQYLQTRLSETGVAPSYVYLFSHKVFASFNELFGGGPEKYNGVGHADELLYLFPVAQRKFIKALPTEKDSRIRKAITELFVNFARTGNPTPSTSNLPKWHPSTEFPLNFYRIGNEYFSGKPMFGMENGGLFEDRAQFWRDLGAHLPRRKAVKDEF